MPPSSTASKKIQPGSRLFNYIKDFLSEGSAQIIGPDGQPSTPSPISRGTPQGSILSPTSFNLTLKNLPSNLSSIPDLCHAIYADDVTIWFSRGNPGTKERTLQDGLDIIQTHAESIGLECSPEKSEHVVVMDRNRKETDLYRSFIRLNVDGRPVPLHPHIHILGFICIKMGRAQCGQ